MWPPRRRRVATGEWPYVAFQRAWSGHSWPLDGWGCWSGAGAVRPFSPSRVASHPKPRRPPRRCLDTLAEPHRAAPPTTRRPTAGPVERGAPTVSAQITVTVAGSERSVAEQTTAGELFEGDRAVVVARVNGQLR